MTQEDLLKTKKTNVIRNPARASYDRITAYEIIDSTPMCHVSYIIDGEPYITPTFQWREADTIFWHGSSASRFLRESRSNKVSMNVMLFDGLVMARSGLHHSANYRSVTLFGTAIQVADDEKTQALKNFVDNLIPGRWDTLRTMRDQEVKATMILKMPISEASVKIRTGGPVDDEEDYLLPIWAGVIPVKQIIGRPESDPKNLQNIDMPDHIKNFKFGN
jgi:uncharacterized protein